MMTHAFVFPGQGSQRVGMGRALAEQSARARVVFEEADDVLGMALSRLCWEGPEDQLQLTENTQPAILATSIAIHSEARERLPPPAVLAGHSLGEYSALVASGSLALGDALRLVRRRGQLMQEAVPVGEGAMAAMLGLDAEGALAVAAAAAAATDRVCTVANHNAPQQFVLAGHRIAVEAATTIAKERGAKRALLLPVSAPFHSPLMAPARLRMTPLLGEVELGDPEIPVVSNVDARPMTSASAVRDALIRQIDQPVRWIESVRHMVEHAGVGLFVELGPGAVLGGMIRRIAPGVKALAVSEPADLERPPNGAGGDG